MKNKNSQRKIKAYSFNEVFKNGKRSSDFQKAYSEEIARLKLARQIKEMRRKNKLTQKEVALKTKMPQSVIARIESGTHGYSLGTLYRVAAAFSKEIVLS